MLNTSASAACTYSHVKRQIETNLEALEYAEVLLSELEVLGQQSEGFYLVELPGSEEAKDEVIVCPQETDVRPRHDHVPHLGLTQKNRRIATLMCWGVWVSW